jgi:polysaccharide biosynthesis transport protein
VENLTRYEPPSTSLSTAVIPSVGGEPERQAGDYLRIAKRRWIIIPIASITLALLAFAVTITKPKVYQSQSEVLVQSPGTLASSSVSSSQYAAIANIIGLEGSSDLATQMEQMTSDQSMSQVAARLGLTVKPEDLKKQYDIEPSKTSSCILAINAFSTSPQKAADLIKGIVAVYNQNMSQDSSTVVGRMSHATFAELDDVGQKLRKAEIAKADFATSTGLIDPDAASNDKVSQLFTLKNDLLDVQKDLAVAKNQYAFYSGQMKILDPTIVPNLSFMSNPRIDSDKAQLEQLEQQRAVLAEQFTPYDDQMVSNQKQIDVIKEQMQQERQQESQTLTFSLGTQKKHFTAPANSYIVTGATQVLNPLREDARQKMADAQATIDSSEVQEATLQATLSGIQQDALKSPDQMRKYGDLSANVDVLRSIYSQLQAQSAQLQARLPAEQDVETFLQNPSIPLHQISPRPLLYSGIAGLLGLLIGCILAVLIDNGDVRVRDDRDAEMLFGRPVLQTIEWSRQLEVSTGTDENAEQFHELACTLGYLGVGRSLRTILLTSATKDEGTTVVASNLAVALAKEGRRVVIIDANVRKPVLHVMFGQQNNEGLAGLMRNGAKPEHALLPVTGSSSLSLIPGGDAEDGSDWANTLNSDKFERILANLHEKADIILIDAPAVFSGYETSVLSDKVDGIIFVSRTNFAARSVVRRAFDLLLNCSAPIIGTVMNDAKE